MQIVFQRLEFFNATEWMEIFEASGAKYAVLTTKHHEGFTLWPSPHSFSWNSVDVGPARDIVGEFTQAAKNSSLKPGLYHSFFEWFNPLFQLDSKNNFTTRNYIKVLSFEFSRQKLPNSFDFRAPLNCMNWLINTSLTLFGLMGIQHLPNIGNLKNFCLGFTTSLRLKTQ